MANKRVLVVDDNADNVESLCELVRLWGYDVEAAEDGKRLPSCLVLPPVLFLCLLFSCQQPAPTFETTLRGENSRNNHRTEKRAMWGK